jgi:uncharacterized protein (DUF1778 family)
MTTARDARLVRRQVKSGWCGADDLIAGVIDTRTNFVEHPEVSTERFAMPRAAQRLERITLRLGRDAKRRLERAAAYSDKTLTDFVIDVALQKADAIVRQREAVTLTRAEWERFQEMLLNPPQSNKRLREAFAEHARIVKR